jgi:deoxycytidylate deaminase
MIEEQNEEKYKHFKRCMRTKCIIPKNVINNLLNNHKLYYNTIIELTYDDMFNKHKKIIDLLDNYYNLHIKNNKYFCNYKSLHVACITFKNRFIIKSNDYNRTYCQKNNITSLHAEHSVIISLNMLCKKESINKNTILYVVRYNRSNKRCLSIPCTHCLIQIVNSNINTLIFSVNHNLFHICKLTK